MRGKINICQPGYGASCALCCGSHNFTGGREAMRSEFVRRSPLPEDFRPEDAAASARTRTGDPDRRHTGQALHDDAIACPHVGFLDREQTLIGCLIYDLSHKPGASGEFFEATCRRFSCLARERLDDSEVLFAARLLGDWYYYGLLINSIQILRELIRAYTVPENVPASVLQALKGGLEAMLEHDESTPRTPLWAAASLPEHD
ncbi:MAG TPA: hypothetical protein PKO25_05150 [Spirochaetota bacterium]|nr:MAG: hypothetical protein BWY96_01141 [Spirochaetes bacterium ADurb.BinA120]HNU91237.1 hypothetical protein [Spirochaetota bacterium]HPI14877.1 hypothetical protein [Spirochaetota bacterium]HPO45937.1 hypothetical protein [Spirochaetota bacterium]